jgi:hypothetical protein
MTTETEFAEGLIVKAPRDGAPDFVKAAISIKREEFISWLSSREGEWVNLDVKEAKSGKWYAAVNAYKPKDAKPAAKGSRRPAPADDFDSSEVPF